VVMRRAAATHDMAQLLAVAHKLKGSAASIGANAMAALCGQIESSAEAGRLDDLGQLLLSLSAEHDRAQAALDSVIASEPQAERRQ
jgi:two-component system, sensor histidine kinase and response regulator